MLVKIFLVIFLFTTSSHAQILRKSINPKLLHTNFFKIFDDFYVSGETTSVRGVKYSYDDYIDGGNRFEIKTELFKRAQNLGQSVFEATPGDRYDSFGTAFHVGDNFVLTNQHVLSTSRANTTSCRSFSIKLNANQDHKELRCKKVHHCDKAIDFCLIEMADHRRGYSLKNQRPPKFSTTQEFGDKLLMMSIGNTRGFGLHAALGYGFKPYGNIALFYAPVFGGNSGGPVINENDEVVSVVRAQSVELVSDESYNVGIPMSLIKAILDKNVSAEVLEKLNF